MNAYLLWLKMHERLRLNLAHEWPGQAHLMPFCTPPAACSSQVQRCGVQDVQDHYRLVLRLPCLENIAKCTDAANSSGAALVHCPMFVRHSKHCARCNGHEQHEHALACCIQGALRDAVSFSSLANSA